MIHVHYSNRVERLVDALAAALPAPGDVEAMFAGPWLVMPSRPLELYVNLELARRRGISGNVETASVRGVFARLCARDLPDVTLVERGHVTGELLALLSDDALKNDPACADIQGYLLGAGSGADAVNRRRVDVARALGTLFDDWTLTKPELLDSWRRGEGAPARAGAGAPSEAAGALARGERALWTGLFGADGRFARRGAAEGRRYLTLDALLAEKLDRAWQPPGAVHFFGLSQLPRGLQLALARLGALTDVRIYTINPCKEFWEDLETRTPRVTPTRARRGPAAEKGKARDTRQLELPALMGGVAPTKGEAAARETNRTRSADSGDQSVSVAEQVLPDNPLLRAWGHAGRESTRLINQLSDGDFEAGFVSLDRSTVLTCLQQDVLERRAGRDREDSLHLPADASLAVLGAPDPRRELETIAAEIWARVSAADAAAASPTVARGAPLRFSDIAVLIAGGDEPYLSLARAVFREAQELPHAIVDQPLASGSHLVECLLALLTLPLGTFTRREVLDVITHPNVRARFPEADAEAWLALCEGLAIAHGADQAALADTYIEGDLFNWDQGLKRLALGLFARGPRGGAEDPVLLPGDDERPTAAAGSPDDAGYLPADVAADARGDAEALALLVRSLLADARFARSARLSLVDWTAFVRALMAAYVVAVSPDDELARLRVFTALDQIAAEAPPGLLVNLGTALEVVRGAVQGLRGTRGQMLGGGVTVGTMSSLRSVPFRVIFVAGLGADRFPSADRPSPFEVTIDRPVARPGDVTPRQQDRYLFLETMLAARDSLVLSYVDRDALTGELREPSPLVLELLDQLERGYLDTPAAPGTGVLRHVPLHRDEDSAIHAAFPAAAAEGRARSLGAALQEQVPEAAGLPPGELMRALSPGVWEQLAPLLRPIALRQGNDVALSRGVPPRLAPARPRLLKLIDLRRFLECPLQGSARIFLGLRDLPDDTAARETADEPFEVPRAVERGLLGDVLYAAWRAHPTPDIAALPELYDQEIGRHRYRALFPTGLFRANVRRRHLRILDQWLEALSVANAVRGPLRRVCFGRPEPFSPPCERQPPIRLTVELPGDGATPVELHGLTEPQLTTGAGSGSLVLATSADRESNDKDSLRAFLDHVALAASRADDDERQDAPGAATICRPSREGPAPAPHRVLWQPLAPAAARAYLTDLVSELLSGVHAYLFPCEPVFRSFDEQSTLRMSLVDRIDQVRADKFYREHSSARFGPVPDPFDYPTPSAALAERYVATRFGLLRGSYPQRPAKSKRGAS